MKRRLFTATTLIHAEECCSHRIKILLRNEAIASPMNRDQLDEFVKHYHISDNT